MDLPRARKHENASSGGNYGRKNSENLKNKDLKQDEFQSEDEDDGSRVIEMGKELSIYGTVNDAKEKKSVRSRPGKARKKWLDDRTKRRNTSVGAREGKWRFRTQSRDDRMQIPPEKVRRGKRSRTGETICPEQQ